MSEGPMVEAVARAMLTRIRDLGVFATWAIDGDDEHALPEDGSLQVLVDGRFDMMEVARAAIQAMRRPSQAMSDALGNVPGGWGHGAWNAGIDAALAVPEEGREP